MVILTTFFSDGHGGIYYDHQHYYNLSPSITIYHHPSPLIIIIIINTNIISDKNHHHPSPLIIIIINTNIISDKNHHHLSPLIIIINTNIISDKNHHQPHHSLSSSSIPISFLTKTIINLTTNFKFETLVHLLSYRKPWCNRSQRPTRSRRRARSTGTSW